MIEVRSRVNANRSWRSLCDASKDRRKRARIDRHVRAATSSGGSISRKRTMDAIDEGLGLILSL
jgi:hypothetical protein